MMKTAALLVVVLASSLAKADFVMDPGATPSPDGAWAYSEDIPAGIGDMPSHFATNLSQFNDAVFRGYVSNPFLKTGQGFDSYQVFSTFLLSDRDQVVPVLAEGDDGKSIFFDNIFAAGGGFASKPQASLSLAAGVAKKITIVGFNGPGGWIFNFGEYDPSTNLIVRDVRNLPGVRTNAIGDFAAVPEPTSIIAGLCLAVTAVFGRRQPATPK